MTDTRVWTDEELNRDISFKRMEEFHYTAQEDFLDQHSDTVNVNIFGGYLIGRFPKRANEVLALLNRRAEVMEFQDLWEYGEEDVAIEVAREALYVYFCDFVNLTGALKARMNKVLIETAEHYGPA